MQSINSSVNLRTPCDRDSELLASRATFPETLARWALSSWRATSELRHNLLCLQRCPTAMSWALVRRFFVNLTMPQVKHVRHGDVAERDRSSGEV